MPAGFLNDVLDPPNPCYRYQLARFPSTRHAVERSRCPPVRLTSLGRSTLSTGPSFFLLHLVSSPQVPILNRSSFEVRLLACVWLVAPGPPESSMTAWEDQQAQQGEWQDSQDVELTGVPPSPGRPGARWGLQRGAGEGPRPAPAPVRLCAILV